MLVTFLMIPRGVKLFSPELAVVCTILRSMKPLPIIRPRCSVKVMTAVVTVVCQGRESFAAYTAGLTEIGEIDPKTDEHKHSYQHAVL